MGGKDGKFGQPVESPMWTRYHPQHGRAWSRNRADGKTEALDNTCMIVVQLTDPLTLAIRGIVQ